MLPIAHISKNKIHTDEWRVARLAHFTSSEAWRLMSGPAGYITYVREKVGEEMTGKPARDEVDTDDTRHGLLYELDALKKFAVNFALKIPLIHQVFITKPDSRTGSTPDGVLVLDISPDQQNYIVQTVEAKCPTSFSRYIAFFECENPMHLKDVEKKYYWQVLDQMLEAGAVVGNFLAYQPDFRSGNLKTLPVPKNYMEKVNGKTLFPVNDDMKSLAAKKIEAENDFIRIREKLIKAGKF